MYPVPDSQVLNWEGEGDLRVPVAAQLSCPHCGQLMGFSFRWSDPSTSLIATTISRCLVCRGRVIFALVNVNREQDLPASEGKLYIYPPPAMRSLLKEINEISAFSNKLALDYASAVRAYNLGEWAPAIASCHRVVEGIVELLAMTEDGEQNLVALVPSLPDWTPDSIRVWLQVLQRIKQYSIQEELAFEATEQAAGQMLDLVEHLIQALFIFPNHVIGIVDHLFDNASKA